LGGLTVPNQVFYPSRCPLSLLLPRLHDCLAAKEFQQTLTRPDGFRVALPLRMPVFNQKDFGTADGVEPEHLRLLVPEVPTVLSDGHG